MQHCVQTIPAGTPTSDFQSGFVTLLNQRPTHDILATEFIDVTSDRKPWLDIGIELGEGENISAFTMGAAGLKGADLWFGADFQLWYRVGVQGAIFRETRFSHTFGVETPGRLYLAGYSRRMGQSNG